jgi:ferredoxin
VTSKVLSEADMAAWVADLVREGTQVIAPVAGDGALHAEYRLIERLEQAALEGALPRRSLKELFLPPSEVLLRYRQRKDGVELEEVPTAFGPRVVLGARPCDAAGVATLDAVMGWGQRDEPWFGRREATAIVSIACPGVDSSCFCAAVGLGPDSTRGSDVLLVPLDRAARRPQASPLAKELEGSVEAFLQDSEPFPGAAEDEARDGAPRPAPAGYLAHPVTPRGEKLLAGRGRPWTPWDRKRAEAFTRAARDRVRQELAILPAQEGETLSRGLDVEVALAAADGGELVGARPSPLAGERTRAARLPGWLARNFDHPLWKSFALRCHGCGACAAVCSTCHCFDVVDEHDSYDRGARRRNWDSCQTAKFTLHASGHNPRQTQAERFRQRVMHKFSVYPSRFDAILCTGCGRCARACAAGMSLREVLGQLARLADAEAEATRIVAVARPHAEGSVR